MSSFNTLAGGFLFHSTLNGRFPQVPFQVDAKPDYRDAFAFEKLSLQGCVGFANQDFSALAENAMPGNAFSGGSRRHGASCGARAAWQAQGLSEGSIC
jgi:hypothetical protein